MIVDYFRPGNLKEAIELLNRAKPKTIPLGGGISISQRKGGELAVVDLQKLKLNQIVEKNEIIAIGSTITIQELINSFIFSKEINEDMKHESTFNLRQVATLAGTLITSDGHSIIGTIFTALGAVMVWEPGNIEVPLVEWKIIRKKSFKGRLITKIIVPREFNLKVETIRNSPESKAKIVIVHMKNTQEDVFAFGGDLEKPIRVERNEINKFIDIAHSHYKHTDLPAKYLDTTIHNLVSRLNANQT
jgi:CO/xanthine dehydrogenase FAD-binding subunit